MKIIMILTIIMKHAYLTKTHQIWNLSYIILSSITNKDQIFSINLCPYAFFSKRNKSTTYIVKTFIINTYNRILIFFYEYKTPKN